MVGSDLHPIHHPKRKMLNTLLIHDRRRSRNRRREVVCLIIFSAVLLTSLMFMAALNGDLDIPILGIYRNNTKGRLASKNKSPIGSKDFDKHFNEAKLIMLWTAWYRDPDWTKMLTKNGGPWVSYKERLENGTTTQNYCYLTTNHSLADTADSIIFHSLDLYHNYSEDTFPLTTRRPGVSYVFFTLEPPQLNRLNFEPYRDAVHALKFNYTMSYSRYSDIVFPFGRVYEFGNKTRSSPNFQENVRYRINGFIHLFSKRPKDAVWIVSDCVTMGRRENIVRSLVSLGIKIDTWGNCFGARQPDRLWQSFGARPFFRQYRFYLAFENALCEEYITEKAFLGLAASANFGVIPIVYGFANYSEFLPEGSYIDASNMKDPKELAEIMKEMSSPSYSWNKLAKFYEWQYSHYIPSDPNWRVVNGWRNLCKHLHSSNPPKPERKSIIDTEEDNTDESLEGSGSNQLEATVFDLNYGSHMGTTAKTSSVTGTQQPEKKFDIRKKIGACIWTSDFDPEDTNELGIQL